MKLVFLRHAKTALNKHGLFCGRIDCDITKEGKEITEKLANDELFLLGFTAIYISPLKRTFQTLRAIYPKCDFIVDERITEISLGDWEGKDKKFVDQNNRKSFLIGEYTPPNAEENHEEVVSRVISFLKAINSIYNEDDSILVITHNGIIRTIKQLLKVDCNNTNNSKYIIIDSKAFEQLDKIYIM